MSTRNRDGGFSGHTAPTVTAIADYNDAMNELLLAIGLRRDLNLSPGKAAAQACHAAVAGVLNIRDSGELAEWLKTGQLIVVLAIDDEQALLTLLDTCRHAGFPAVGVADSGRTEVAPGTITAVAIGPSRRAAVKPYIERFRTY